MREPTSSHERQPWRPDYVVIGLVVLVLAILLVLTFDLWAPSH